MLVMGSITTLLHDHWELTAFVRGLMVSIVFCGFSAGNVLSGFIGDGHGRKPSIILAYLLIGGFGLATSAVCGCSQKRLHQELDNMRKQMAA